MSDYRIPQELRYTAEDEWIRTVDGRIVVGVTDYAQQALGDVVYVELPAPGDAIVKGDAFGVIESVKAVSDLYAPVSGEVHAVNEALADHPEAVNEDCYGSGWMLEVVPSDDGELTALMDAEAYAKSVAERSD